MNRLLAVACVAVALGTAAPLGVYAADTIPTQDQIKTMVDGGQYTDALKAIAQAVPATAQGSRYDLYMLRGEALLHIKQGLSAVAAFDLAQGETTKPLPWAVAGATSYLIKQSTNMTFTPKTGDSKTPYDIVDAAQRKMALTALFEQELVKVSAGYQAVKNGQSLPPIIEFAKTLGIAHMLELAATGDDAKTVAMVKDLATHSETLMTAACTDMTRQTDTINTRANQFIPITSTVPDPNNAKRTIQKTQYRKRGLTQGDAATLNNIVGTCDKFAPAAKDLGPAAATEQPKTIG